MQLVNANLNHSKFYFTNFENTNFGKSPDLNLHDNSVNSVAFSPDGKILASGSAD